MLHAHHHSVVALLLRWILAFLCSVYPAPHMCSPLDRSCTLFPSSNPHDSLALYITAALFPLLGPIVMQYLYYVMWGVQISRTELYLIDLTDTTKNVDALEGSRDVVDESSLDPTPFAYSGVSKRLRVSLF